jgi:hypothetical protein
MYLKWPKINQSLVDSVMIDVELGREDQWRLQDPGAGGSNF